MTNTFSSGKPVGVQSTGLSMLDSIIQSVGVRAVMPREKTRYHEHGCTMRRNKLAVNQ